MYLLDTNVVSELRRARSGRANPHVVAWVQRRPVPALYLSVITAMEIEQGVLQVLRHDPRQAERLQRWLDSFVLTGLRNRLLPVDLRVALQCARLNVPDPRFDRDALIGATALVHGLTVVTRNVADFQPMGVTVINPWQPAEVRS